ncbi:MAG: cohesin domain-containing protein [Deltaproteobacteria bacterium]|nr:cohesin domain-containing protein [Deltaproteobacteria bacterium]
MPKKTLLALALVTAVLSAAQASAQPQLTAGTAAGEPGETVEVPLLWSGEGEAVALQVDVQFDPDVLSIAALEGGQLGVHTLESAAVSPGRLRLLLFASGNPLLLDGESARFQVSIDPLASTSADGLLGLSAAVVGDGMATSLPVQLGDGLVEVLSGPLPRVGVVGTVPDTGDGRVLPDEEILAAITRFTARFSESVFDPIGDSDADDVTNPANYLLLADGGDGVFDTVDCASGPSTSDEVVAIQQVLYDDLLPAATLLLDSANPLPRGRYRLMICGSTSIVDLNQNPLDGNADGTAGDDFAVDFEVLRTNLLKNPNFDQDLAFWSLASPSAAEILHHGDDADDAASSGSAEVRNLTGAGETFALAQCVALDGTEVYRVGGRARVLSGLPNDPVEFASVSFFDDLDCGGELLGTASSNQVLGDTAGAWSEELASEVVAPVGGGSALVSFIVEAGVSADFVTHFDSLFFARRTAFFADGFESGDTSAWTLTVP